MAATRRPYHPPVLSDWLPPLAGPPGYIMGETGPQGFGTADFYVAQIPCATARAVIIEHHYSHRVVNNSYLHLGVFRKARSRASCNGAMPSTRPELARSWKAPCRASTWN
ncbi:hypothetical protein [Desulfovibrio piger]|uniref:Mom family adenine methylcarbamoylation protein n=1 Tax=Desulfovibrio piger TaxID=901 RepID=UPI003A93AE14